MKKRLASKSILYKFSVDSLSAKLVRSAVLLTPIMDH